MELSLYSILFVRLPSVSFLCSKTNTAPLAFWSYPEGRLNWRNHQPHYGRKKNIIIFITGISHSHNLLQTTHTVTNNKPLKRRKSSLFAQNVDGWKTFPLTKQLSHPLVRSLFIFLGHRAWCSIRHHRPFQPLTRSLCEQVVVSSFHHRRQRQDVFSLSVFCHSLFHSTVLVWQWGWVSSSSSSSQDLVSRQSQSSSSSSSTETVHF